MSEKYLLVIEDGRDDAVLIEKAFRSLDGCTAIVCRNLSEAKSYLGGIGLYNNRTTHPFPHAVICDYQLVGEDATDFLKWIKLGEQFPELPVYILTGKASANEMEQARLLGALDVLQKPSEFLDFKQMLADLAAKLCKSEDFSECRETAPSA